LKPDVIDALYAASQAGVKITLLCAVFMGYVPELRGLSENIRVKSIVGPVPWNILRSRFCNGCRITARPAISSADWRANLKPAHETVEITTNNTVKAQIVARSWPQPDVALDQYNRTAVSKRADVEDGHLRLIATAFHGKPVLSLWGAGSAGDVPQLTHYTEDKQMPD
jgi:polyphosphate kinase